MTAAPPDDEVACPPADASTTIDDRPSFDELYSTAYRPMVRLAALIVDTVDDAEQVVQDAFVAMYRRYDRIVNPGGYLRVAVTNGSRKVLRRRQLTRRQPTPTVETSEIEFNHVLDAIRRLPFDQRVLIALRYDQQMTDSELAEELQLPIGTVKSRLHRAIGTLRQEFE